MAVSIDIVGDELVVSVTGPDVALALRRSISVPVAAITSVEIGFKNPLLDQLGFRIRGASIPGLLVAGTYSVWASYRRFEGERQFWFTKRATEVLVIETDIARPSRLVIETEDRHELRRRLNEELELV